MIMRLALSDESRGREGGPPKWRVKAVDRIGRVGEAHGRFRRPSSVVARANRGSNDGEVVPGRLRTGVAAYARAAGMTFCRNMP